MQKILTGPDPAVPGPLTCDPQWSLANGERIPARITVQLGRDTAETLPVRFRNAGLQAHAWGPP